MLDINNKIKLTNLQFRTTISYIKESIKWSKCK